MLNFTQKSKKIKKNEKNVIFLLTFKYQNGILLVHSEKECKNDL